VRAREVTESESNGNISQGHYEIFHRQAGERDGLMDPPKKAETLPHIYSGERTMKARYLLVVVIGVSGLATLSMPAVAGWDGLLGRVGERFSTTIEDRLGGTSEKAVGKVFDKMDETVDCVAGDEKCGRRAGEEQPSGGSATAK